MWRSSSAFSSKSGRKQPTGSGFLSTPDTPGLDVKGMNHHAFVDLLNRDPDLAHISSHSIPKIVQAIFVSTGCDYISFFQELERRTFFKFF